ncbi:MAG: dephospho-CoA kinase [Parabacteroides sp.]|nr:dephospho-CoA kinase [Parabacteroides sp.]
MGATVFNQAQMQLLEMMSFVSTPESLADLNKVISDYFAQQAQREIDRLWETGELNESKVESFRALHERTPYT